ncbi:MAG: TfoX/Sxy family protein [Oscillospiraceae bacterium]|nr:TfoX/Sxy family protein [Oscillospiraceae bacterium]
MASHPDFVDFVVDQLRDAGAIRSRRMFGEYGLFCDGVFFGVICDDQFFVKITPEGQAAFPHLPRVPSHEGARDSFLVEDVEDQERMTELTRITCEVLQRQKRRK